MGSKIVLMLVAAWVCVVPVFVTAGFTQQRRPNSWRRVFVSCLSPPSLLLVVALVAPEQATIAVLSVIIVGGLVVAPVLGCRSSDSPPGPSDQDGGGGLGPDPPVAPPKPPTAGIPLPDADPWQVRVRDHGSPKIAHMRRSRSREPDRDPASPTRR